MAAKKEEQFRLEQAFAELEQIMEQLEDDQVPLADALKLYGQGAKLLTACKHELCGIEKEMQIIEEGLEGSEGDTDAV